MKNRIRQVIKPLVASNRLLTMLHRIWVKNSGGLYRFLYKLQAIVHKRGSSDKHLVPHFINADLFDKIRYGGFAGSFKIKHYAHPPLAFIAPPNRKEEHDIRTFRMHSEHYSAPEYSFELPNGRVFAPSVALITEDDCLLAHESFDPTAINTWHWGVFQQVRMPDVKKVSGSVAVGLGYGDANISHFLYTTLPRLLTIWKGYSRDEIDAYYTRTKGPAFFRDALELLQIPVDKRISCEDHPHLQAERLIATGRTFLHSVEPWVIEDIRACFFDLLGSPTGGRRVYLSRANAKVRKVHNEEEVAALARKYDFEIIYPEQLSFVDQVKTLMQSSATFGVHGANMACSSFMKEGSKMFEIFPEAYVMPCYWQSARHAKLDYDCVVCRTENGKRDVNLLGQDVAVDTRILEQWMKSV